MSSKPTKTPCRRGHARRSGEPIPVLSVVAALLIMVSPADAATPTGEGWGLYSTEHFTFYSSLDETSTRAVGARLEELRAVLEQQFPDADFTPPVPTLAFLFGERASFEPFSLGGGASFFAPHVHANFVAMVATDAEQAMPVVYRQYVNAVVANQIPQAPLWLREGLAELLSTFTVDGDAAVIGAVPERDMGLLDSSMNVAEVVALREPPASGEKAAAFSQRAWTLVHYLVVEDTPRSQKLRAWIDRLQEDESQSAAFLQSYGGTAAALDAELAAYSKRDPPPTWTIPLQQPAATGGSLTPLPPQEALVALTDLLLHTQPEQTDLAAAMLDAAAARDPDSALVLAARGLLAERRGDRAAARDLYSRAIEGFPANEIPGVRDGFRLYFYSGDAELDRLGQRRPQTDAERQQLASAVGAFRRCVELRPTYGEAWARLGYALNLEESPPPDAVPALERAYELLPEREDIAMNLLLAYARVGERTKATTLVDNLAYRGESADTVTRAREVLFQIDYNAAAQMIRKRQIDEAAALLGRIAAESTNPTMQQRARELLSRIGR